MRAVDQNNTTSWSGLINKQSRVWRSDEDDSIDRMNDWMNENESQTKPNKSKRIKLQIEYDLDTETNTESNMNRIQIEKENIINNNAFYLLVAVLR